MITAIGSDGTVAGQLDPEICELEAANDDCRIFNTPTDRVFNWSGDPLDWSGRMNAMELEIHKRIFGDYEAVDGNDDLMWDEGEQPEHRFMEVDDVA